MVSLQERQRATETLFGNSDQISGLFNLDHNLTAYNQLVQEKYNDLETYAETEIEPEPQPQQILESYYMPEQTYAPKSIPVYQAPALENYYNSANPIPVTEKVSFRPKIYDTNLKEVDTNTFQSTTKIAEVNFANAPTVAEGDTDTDFIPTFRLSAKGIIAVVGLIAVAVLVFALIIVNSVGIAGSSARIQQLKASNQELAYTLSDARATYLVEVEKAALLANDAVFGEGTNPDGTLASGYSPVILEQMAPSKPNITQPSSGTNFFDQLSRFFSKLFGGN